MGLLKIFAKTKPFLSLYNFRAISLFILVTIAFCQGCDTNGSSLEYASHVKGNLADMTVNQLKLVGQDKNFFIGQDKNFILTFTPNNNKAPINLSKYFLYFEVCNGEVNYVLLQKQEGSTSGQKKNYQAEGFRLPIADFFGKA